MELWSRADPQLREVVCFALRCRALALLLQAVFNLLIPDHAADAFSPPRSGPRGPWDALVERLLGGLGRWDAEHFLFIAERGYLLEHNCAFLPLFPLALRLLAALLPWPLQLQPRSRLLLAAALLNALLSALAAAALLALGRAVLRRPRQAFVAALLFSVSPAGVFMAAAYSESAFALLAFSAMWQLEKGHGRLSGLLFGLAAGARANGLLNAGFFLYARGRRFALQLQGTAASPCKLPCLWKRALGLVTSAVLTCAGICLPFALFQYYAYLRFCQPGTGLGQSVPEPLLQLARDKGYRVAGVGAARPPWCSQRFPLVYSYIQDTYWNVGFLRYFEFRQVPNFLLALPVTLLGSWAAWTYVSTNPRHCLTLGLERSKGDERGKPRDGFCGPAAFVYVVHSTALLVFGFFCMHVQVLTRFLGSSSPILYWFAAHLLQEHEPLLWSTGTDNPTSGEPVPGKSHSSCGKGTSDNPVVRLLLNWRSITPLSKSILGFFLGYWLLGLILHCNFLPWT
ncbi:GPI mannosyltransferase 2 isoform X1 [Passer montanus]|uniref:GPI mannosyltransferase 2 isoform X1 n=1 Tax=Passer montanus TaxID=9160 RepID=UPI001961DEFB|nr:GPI mannosyltransferase 2 isoform X1 [Passer montanus]XP_039589583.1 GPI mannosyltransferase 2 isoform X1 [Passer montanus]XP_039589584.1 GPI mannosyltransferase 2 isoform X1 [Passer montanus]XP_039589585.1 GPI mannosyltransferase 2 isoform X1 [Passer montanus]XP_039589586.1 GPI mannosyltransferase 2 isoform X1 [Passer montanus]XP_039589587.1 GPI mannosyltransferase 2 isoform X1 [Passer montanus]